VTILQRRHFLFAFFVLFASCAPTKETGEKKEQSVNHHGQLTATFKILSVNCGHSLKNRSDVKRFAQWLKSEGADIVALQQIERPVEGAQTFDAVAELAKAADMNQFFGTARYWEGFNSGNALFSTYPIQQTDVHSLPVGKGKVRRSLSYGIVDVGLKSVGIASTELDEDSRIERISQAEEISSLAQTLADYPFIVCGGFYEGETGKVSLKMMERFNEANSLNEATANFSQRVYVRKDSLLRPISIDKVRQKEKSLEGVLVTFEAKQ